MKEIDNFLKKSSWYLKRRILYCKRFLFYKPPETGKISLALTLAGIFRLLLYYIPLEDKDFMDGHLFQLFNHIPSYSMIVLKDIDAARIDQESTESVTLSDLLNSTDGITSLNGIITIFTTNHHHKLDKALLHPECVDIKFTFPLAMQDQVQFMFNRMYLSGQTSSSTEDLAMQFADAVDEGRLSPAEVQGILLHWKDNPQGAVKQAENRVGEEKGMA